MRLKTEEIILPMYIGRRTSKARILKIPQEVDGYCRLEIILQAMATEKQNCHGQTNILIQAELPTLEKIPKTIQIGGEKFS